MWNLMVAYALIAVLLVAYLASVLLRTRRIERELEAKQAGYDEL